MNGGAKEVLVGKAFSYDDEALVLCFGFPLIPI